MTTKRPAPRRIDAEQRLEPAPVEPTSATPGVDLNAWPAYPRLPVRHVPEPRPPTEAGNGLCRANRPRPPGPGNPGGTAGARPSRRTRGWPRRARSDRSPPRSTPSCSLVTSSRRKIDSSAASVQRPTTRCSRRCSSASRKKPRTKRPAAIVRIASAAAGAFARGSRPPR